MKKGQRPRHKVVCVLVEGESEIRILNPILSSLYDSIDSTYEIFFPTINENEDDIRGDITSKYGINPENIMGCIIKLFMKPFFEQNKLYPKDISEIIHLIDIDGVYMEDSAVIYGSNDKIFYSSDTIRTDSVSKTIDRNHRKKANIDFLYKQNSIKIEQKTIPYSTFFFSCNLDHVLHNNANIITGKEKIAKADDYVKQYMDDPMAFVNAIKAIPGTLLDLDYDNSWDFIRERGNHSLERHTNINLLFDKLSDITQQSN